MFSETSAGETCSKKLERHNRELVSEYQCTHKSLILEKIIDRNQGLLHFVLRKFSYFPDPYEDLLQVANLGLIKSVQRFDLSRGIEFSSYACAVVDGEVRHYLRDNVLLKQPRWLSRAEKALERTSIDLTVKLKRRPTVIELAAEVNISEEGILEILRHSVSNGLHWIDDCLNRENTETSIHVEKIRSLYYESFSLPVEDKIALQQALRVLNSFQKKVVFLLFFKDLTQTQVANELGSTQRQVSRESAKALKRLKSILKTKVF